MAYVPVPKDLSRIKTKVVFNLTKRQIICFAAALLMGLPLFFLLKDSTGTSVAAFVMIVVMLPCFLIAMYEKHGQPLDNSCVALSRSSSSALKFESIRPTTYTPPQSNKYSFLRRYIALFKMRNAYGNMFDKLSHKQRQQIKKLIATAKSNPAKPQSFQASILYLAMYPAVLTG